jgi:tripeptide aminopeptidase
MITIHDDAAIDRLLRFLSVEGVTGHEAAIGRVVAGELRSLGVPSDAIRFDDANTRIPLPTETGNLIVMLPGTRPGPRLLFMTHLDTVPLCAGAKPVRDGDRIKSATKTALGGDNRTGCAVLATLASTLIAQKLPHPPLTLLFTVREESGLFGARNLRPEDLAGPTMGFNFDGRSASDIYIGAVGAERWEVEIAGKASHAGVAPEKGISSTAVAALAIADVVKNGWFGKVTKRSKSGNAVGTSNVGPFGGQNGRSAGDATNVVTDYVRILGESRSHDSRFAKRITAEYKKAFQAAGKRIKDDRGKHARVKFTSRLDYYPFRMREDAPVVKHAWQAVEWLGGKPAIKIANGGLDANWVVRHGVPTVTVGAGQNAIHTVDEFVDVPEFLAGCRLAVALASI